MFKKLDGYNTAVEVAAGLDAFTDEVMENNSEYHRGIIELIAYAFIDTEDNVEPSNDEVWNEIIADGKKYNPM